MIPLCITGGRKKIYGTNQHASLPDYGWFGIYFLPTASDMKRCYRLRTVISLWNHRVRNDCGRSPTHICHFDCNDMEAMSPNCEAKNEYLNRLKYLFQIGKLLSFLFFQETSNKLFHKKVLITFKFQVSRSPERKSAWKFVDTSPMGYLLYHSFVQTTRKFVARAWCLREKSYIGNQDKVQSVDCFTVVTVDKPWTWCPFAVRTALISLLLSDSCFQHWYCLAKWIVVRKRLWQRFYMVSLISVSQGYSLLSNVMCVSSFHLSNPREVVPRISDKLCKS